MEGPDYSTVSGVRTNQREERILVIRGAEYSLDELLRLMKPPSFVPISQTEGGPMHFAPVMERVMWMRQERARYVNRLEEVIGANPRLASPLMSPLFRAKLYLEWLIRGDQEILDGTVSSGGLSALAMVGSSPDLPPPPTGTDTERDVLPGDWYRRFIDTVFVNAWIRWFTLASYRAMRYFWMRTYDMLRIVARIRDRNDDRSEESVVDREEIRQHITDMTHVARVLNNMGSRNSIPPEELFNVSEVQELKRQARELQRRMGAQSNELKRMVAMIERMRADGGITDRQSINRAERAADELLREISSVFRELKTRNAEMIWAERMSNPAVTNNVYPERGVREATRHGMLVPGSNGGLFSRESYVNTLYNFAITAMDGNPLIQVQVIRLLHNTAQTAPQNGPIKARWFSNGSPNNPAAFLRNFVKCPESLTPTRFDKDLYEAAPHVEVIRVPTASYRLISGFTNIIENIWTHQFRIIDPPNVAKIVFDLPTHLSLPADISWSRNPYVVRPGYIGGLSKSWLGLRNVCLANPDNLGEMLESMFASKYSDSVVQARSTVAISRVCYGPRNQLPEIELHIDQSIHGEPPLVYSSRRTMVLKIPEENKRLITFHSKVGPRRSIPLVDVNIIERIVILDPLNEESHIVV